MKKRRLSYRDDKYHKVIYVHDQAGAITALEPGIIAIVAPEGRFKSLKFFCPCGCGTMVSINLAPGSGKAWHATIEPNDDVTLWPSVRLETGCRSHFVIWRNHARLLYGMMPRMSASDYKDWWSE